jgi:hypothetical protein
VGEVVAGMAHVRQRANALVYVRGLVEHGGRKSLAPTLWRLGESAARYEPESVDLAALSSPASTIYDGFRMSRCSNSWPTRPGIRPRSCAPAPSGSSPRSTPGPG